AAPAIAAPPKPASSNAQDVRVIVMSTTKKGDAKDAGDNVRHKHGQVVDTLDIADAVLADLSPDELADLANDKGVVVVPNFPVSVAAASDLTGSTRAPAAVFPATTGATTASTTMGLNGQGVTVAV